jgi:PPOX class probable F420-dependent enzyme
MAVLPERARVVIDAPEYATLATSDKNGQPLLSVVWVKTDGNDVLVSTTTDRRKYRDVIRDPWVGLLVFPKEQPYVYVSIQGTATVTTEGGAELIQELSQRYSGEPYTFDGPNAVRAVIRIAPTKVIFSDPASRRASSARRTTI